MHDSVAFEIKALLTLALLKSGTSSKDIQTAVNLAAAARLMASEEYAGLGCHEDNSAAAQASNIHAFRNGETVPAALPRPFEPHLDVMNSDIKALLSLLLLQNGASPKEIQTTLKLAAAAREAGTEQEAMEETVDIPESRRGPTAKQPVRNDHLAPVSKVSRAA